MIRAFGREELLPVRYPRNGQRGAWVLPDDSHRSHHQVRFRRAARERNQQDRRRVAPRACFKLTCAQNDIDHRLTRPRHPWTDGQVERMNRTINDATVKRYNNDSHDQLQRQLTDLAAAYNFGRRTRTLKRLTPYEASCTSGSRSHNDPRQIRPTKFRDQTASLQFRADRRSAQPSRQSGCASRSAVGTAQ